ncbi:hypothetical protein RN001_009620 [Aquatica leii]|uniref:Uncharacterized protein n=1 Tax=Aquatica leii TaxID=1421715 RepID=A0AAN7PTY1_9COLE|nr:hypothetical protein RN001_009620 [Aquatica leii]
MYKKFNVLYGPVLNMAPTLYMFAASPAVRAVLITAEAIDFKFNEIILDLLNGEQLTETYMKVNPLHTVPALDDDGNILYDSHVINTYILDKYGKDDFLYPKDIYKRSLVQQGLAFDLGNLYPAIKEVNMAYFRNEITCLTPSMIEMLLTVYEYLEQILSRHGWVSLDHVSLADISCYTTVTSLDYHITIKPEKYPNISNWIKRCSELPYFKNDSEHLQTFCDILEMLKTYNLIE